MIGLNANETEFKFTKQQLQDRGVPARSTNTTIGVIVNDNDDLSPKFTKGVYRTRINEFYPITVSFFWCGFGGVHTKYRYLSDI